MHRPLHLYKAKEAFEKNPMCIQYSYTDAYFVMEMLMMACNSFTDIHL